MECSVLGQLRSGESTLATREPWNQRGLIEDERPHRPPCGTTPLSRVGLLPRKPWNQSQLIEDEHPPWREHPNKQSTSCHENRGIRSTLLRTSHQARHKQRRFRLKHDSYPSQSGCQGAPKLSC